MIREATFDDLEKLMPICEEMHRLAQNENFGLNYDLETAQNYVAHHIEKKDRACFIAEQNKVIVGTLGLSMIPWDLGLQKRVIEEWFYIDPIVRGSGLAKVMLSLAEAWTEIKGAKTLWMAALQNNNRGMKKFYERKGYKLMYSFYVKEVRNGQRRSE